MVTPLLVTGVDAPEVYARSPVTSPKKFAVGAFRMFLVEVGRAKLPVATGTLVPLYAAVRSWVAPSQFLRSTFVTVTLPSPAMV